MILLKAENKIQLNRKETNYVKIHFKTTGINLWVDENYLCLLVRLDWTVWNCCFSRSKMAKYWHFHMIQPNSGNKVSNKDPVVRKCSKLGFFLVLVFKTKKHVMANPGFIRDLLRHHSQICVRPGHGPLSLQHFVCPCSKQWASLFKMEPCGDGGPILNALLSSKFEFPCLSATSLSEESRQSHSGNVFNNKNSNQIIFTVEYNFKLNKISFL